MRTKTTGCSAQNARHLRHALLSLMYALIRIVPVELAAVTARGWLLANTTMLFSRRDNAPKENLDWEDLLVLSEQTLKLKRIWNRKLTKAVP